MIKAAGAVVWREDFPLEVEILLVHRLKYDDWSFPKGKVEESESWISAAFREVREESGVTAVFGQYLGSSTYKLEMDRKRVKYWMAQALPKTEAFVANEEVDSIQWVSAKDAKKLLTHDGDREILKEFIDRDRYTSTIILLRHAKAVKRSEWNDYDINRPLSNEGHEQAKHLISHLEPFGIDGIFASDASRCYSTVEPMSQNLKKRISLAAEINEESFEKDPKIATNYIRNLMRYPGNQLVTSHNPVIPHVLTKIARVEYSADDLNPADAWVIHHRGDKIYSVEFLRRPKI